MRPPNLEAVLRALVPGHTRNHRLQPYQRIYDTGLVDIDADEFYTLPYVTADAREAWELLQVRDLLPPDDDRRMFACPRCNLGANGTKICGTCVNDSGIYGPRPTGMEALVTWASLGPALILRAEALAEAALKGWLMGPRGVTWLVGGPRISTAWAGIMDHPAQDLMAEGLHVGKVRQRDLVLWTPDQTYWDPPTP